MVFRDRASFGKRQEYVAIAELLKREYDVYMTLVDDRGIAGGDGEPARQEKTHVTEKHRGERTFAVVVERGGGLTVR